SAPLLGFLTQRNNIVEGCQIHPVQWVGCLTGYVDSSLIHCPLSIGMDGSRIDRGTMHFNLVSTVVARKAFRHMSARRVPIRYKQYPCHNSCRFHQVTPRMHSEKRYLNKPAGKEQSTACSGRIETPL